MEVNKEVQQSRAHREHPEMPRGVAKPDVISYIYLMACEAVSVAWQKAETNMEQHTSGLFPWTRQNRVHCSVYDPGLSLYRSKPNVLPFLTRSRVDQTNIATSCNTYTYFRLTQFTTVYEESVHKKAIKVCCIFCLDQKAQKAHEALQIINRDLFEDLVQDDLSAKLVSTTSFEVAREWVPHFTGTGQWL